MAVINTGVGASFLKFAFTDDDGEIIASFRMNPGDVKLALRCQEVSAYFEDLRDRTPEHATLEDAVKLNDELPKSRCLG